MEKVLYLKTIHKSHLWVDLIKNWQKIYNWTPSVIVGNNIKNQDFLKGEFENIELYDHSEALRGVNPDFLSTEYVFSEKELNYISEYENDFISMIDRWSINSSKVDYLILRNYYINMVRIWIKILIQKDISLVILPSIPHRLYDYACYVASRVLKLPYLMIERTGEIRLKNNNYILSGFVVDNINDRTNLLYRRYLEEKVNLIDEDFKLITHMQGSYQNSVPNYYSKNEILINRKFSLINMLAIILKNINKSIIFLVVGFMNSKTIIKFTYKTRVTSVPRLALRLEVFIEGIINKIKVKKAYEFYNQNLSKPTYKNTYVYIAPHLKPERSTVPDAGYFQDLELMIDLISKYIPKNCKIYYKEHKGNFRTPTKWNNILRIGMYMRLKNKYPNLLFINIDTNPHDLIDNAFFVATATGTTGWESITRGKHVLIFGDTWYRHFSGVFFIKSNKDIQNAINKIIDGVAISYNEIAGYAKFLLANSNDVFDIERYNDLEHIKTNNNFEYFNIVDDYCLFFVEKLASIRANEQ
jgi:hypothetical protein